MSVDSMTGLLLHQLGDLHASERQILLVWPTLVRRASSRNLKLALEEHRIDTERHLARLYEAFEVLDSRPFGTRCRGMEAVLVECFANLAEHSDGPIRDAGLIADCRRVEAYEMAVYGTARVLAEAMGHSHVVALIDRTLAEEEAADQRLDEMARNEVYPAAVVAAIRADAAAGHAPAIPIARAVERRRSMAG
jgi:ferritin-like metal-binding protein YciE